MSETMHIALSNAAVRTLGIFYMYLTIVWQDLIPQQDDLLGKELREAGQQGKDLTTAEFSGFLAGMSAKFHWVRDDLDEGAEGSKLSNLNLLPSARDTFQQFMGHCQLNGKACENLEVMYRGLDSLSGKIQTFDRVSVRELKGLLLTMSMACRDLAFQVWQETH